MGVKYTELVVGAMLGITLTIAYDIGKALYDAPTKSDIERLIAKQDEKLARIEERTFEMAFKLGQQGVKKK